ncbi:MAG: lipoate--protein ligase family protein, partial [Tannerella sp.]|nr:lipoate--protein ligase family protein [Tannerella sp.]
MSQDKRETLFFYVNKPCVVVGSNQLIEAEVDVGYCKHNGIEIVRRISGGGAVYHDTGNINFSFVTNKNGQSALDIDFLTPIIDALRSMGIDAVAGRRKEILAEGKKISGTSSYISGDRILFHGTLLHRVSMHHLHSALRGDATLRGRSVASVPAEVANIADLTDSSEPTA